MSGSAVRVAREALHGLQDQRIVVNDALQHDGCDPCEATVPLFLASRMCSWMFTPAV